MTHRWTPLAITYLVVSIVGLIGTWTLNILAINGQSSFFGEWFSNPPATQSLQVDLLVLAVASGIFIVVEGRRLGMRWAWVFLPLAAVTAAAFAVPLFLALRERRLAVGRSSVAGDEHVGD
jgi:Ca2+/Na+ antiporter